MEFQRPMTQEETSEFLLGLRLRLESAKHIEIEAEQGTEDTTVFGAVWKEYKPNGTFTITIKINGGAMDT